MRLGVFAILPLFAAATALAEEVVVHVNMRGNGPAITARQNRDSEELLQQAYPGRRVIHVNANRIDLIAEALRGRVQGDVKVAALHVDAHGRGADDPTNPRELLLGTSGGHTVMGIYGELAGVFVDAAFRPVLDRLAPNASLLITGCALLEGMPPEVRRRTMETVAGHFRLRSGKLFMAETKTGAFAQLAGWNHEEYNEGFREELPTGLYRTFRGIAITLSPLLAVHDRLSYNQGWTLLVEPGKTRIMRQRMDEAMASSALDAFRELDRRSAVSGRNGSPSAEVQSFASEAVAPAAY